MSLMILVLKVKDKNYIGLNLTLQNTIFIVNKSNKTISNWIRIKYYRKWKSIQIVSS